MNYKILINEFEGPMDLLLHLVKISDIDICNISIEEVTRQYLDYISAMEELNLDIASEYLIVAAELIEIKSAMLLPRPVIDDDDEYEEDPKEKLIKRLLEYKKYKEVTSEFKKLEEERKQIYTKEISDLSEFKNNDLINMDDIDLNSLMDAFNKFLSRKQLEQPLNTKIARKEYSVHERSNEIRNILKEKKKMKFEDLFDKFTKDYIVVTFLSILALAKRQELIITQDNNFDNIMLSLKERK